MFVARRWLMGTALGVLVLTGVQGPAAERTVNRAESEQRLRQDITLLASDEYEGRGPLTKGIDRAAEHIAAEFKKVGLKPGGVDGSWFQPFPLGVAILEAPSHLELTGPQGQTIRLTEGVHFSPMGIGHSGQDTGGVVFAGYGITNEKAHYDDYAGLDVTNKVVVVLRGMPSFGDKDLDMQLVTGSSFTAKSVNAEKHHAAALLVINDKDTARTGDDLFQFNYTALERRSPAELAVFHVRRSVLERMLPGDADLEQIEQTISRVRKPQSQALTGWKASFAVRIKRGDTMLRNVIGVLEGKGRLANETIVIGAHYDHLGWWSRSSLGNLRKPAIHHGADDNGSGTTSVLELARRFAAQPDRVGRRLVFITFSGEELGLNGSVYYCKNPLFPLSSTAAMYNLDMVGRLRNDTDTGLGKVLTEGSGTAKAFPPLLERLANDHKFKLTNKASGFGPSDHDSFCRKKVPVLFVWTGYHDDYHRPSDTADKIDIAGMRRIVDFSEEAVTALATMARPEYVEVKSPTRPTTMGPRMGIRPDYSDEGEGVLLGGVAEGQPAAKAGMKEGDRIVEIGGKPVKGLESYMEIMATQQKGATIEVTVVRGKQRTKLQVKLE
jgi:hypothetical protein